jgi:hypothetical protein
MSNQVCSGGQCQKCLVLFGSSLFWFCPYGKSLMDVKMLGLSSA